MSEQRDWTEEEISAELERCKKSPYYFMTTYWRVLGKPFTTRLTEEEFNKEFYRIQSGFPPTKKSKQ